jgi:hypothetical protein
MVQVILRFFGSCSAASRAAVNPNIQNKTPLTATPNRPASDCLKASIHDWPSFDCLLANSLPLQSQ